MTPEPQIPAGALGFLPWVVVLAAVITLDSSDMPVSTVTENDGRWFEHDGTLRGL